MKGFMAFLLLFSLLPACEREKPLDIHQKAPQAEDTYRKELETVREELKRDVKIKLRRDGKGNYSWEIQGKDVNEVLRINETLARKLSE
jgi:hypothetical protein